MVGEDGEDGPYDAEDGDDKEDEDVGWGQGVVGCVDVDEVGQHAHCWDLVVALLERVWQIGGGGRAAYQCDYLQESPEGEHNAENHLALVGRSAS